MNKNRIKSLGIGAGTSFSDGVKGNDNRFLKADAINERHGFGSAERLAVAGNRGKGRNFFIHADTIGDEPSFGLPQPFAIGTNRKERLNYFLNDKPRVGLAERCVIAGLIVAIIAALWLCVYHEFEARHARMLEYIQSEEYRAAERALFN